MATLEEILGIDAADPEAHRARALAVNDRKLLQALVEIREERGLSQTAVAEKLGISQPSVAAFESTGSNPKLSTIRRYAQAVGALIRHEVTQDVGQLVDEPNRWTTAHIKSSSRSSSTKITAVKKPEGAASFRFHSDQIYEASKSKRRDFALAA